MSHHVLKHQSDNTEPAPKSCPFAFADTPRRIEDIALRLTTSKIPYWKSPRIMLFCFDDYTRMVLRIIGTIPRVLLVYFCCSTVRATSSTFLLVTSKESHQTSPRDLLVHFSSLCYDASQSAKHHSKRTCAWLWRYGTCNENADVFLNTAQNKNLHD